MKTSSPMKQTRRQHLRTLSTAMAAVACRGWARAAAPSPAGWLLVTNKGDRTLSIVDPASNKQIATIAEEGITGHELATSLDGKRVFVPIYGSSGVGKAGTDGQLIRVIDLEKRAIVGTIDFGKGVRPHCAVMCRKSGLLYVTTELEKTVTIIDPTTLKILGSVPTGEEQSHMLAVTRDGRRGYTANVAPGNVSVLDLEERKLLKTIPIARMTQRISLSVDDRYAFTADQFDPRIAVIDTTPNEVKQWITLPDIAYGTAPSPDGKLLVAALININEVGLIDLATMKVTATVKVPKAPQEVLVRPDGAVAYVSCDASKQVAVINLAEAKLETLIDVGTTADGLAWAVNS
jgi:DNA-binding beta-propeller fold protein YncE